MRKFLTAILILSLFACSKAPLSNTVQPLKSTVTPDPSNPSINPQTPSNPFNTTTAISQCTITSQTPLPFAIAENAQHIPTDVSPKVKLTITPTVAAHMSGLVSTETGQIMVSGSTPFLATNTTSIPLDVYLLAAKTQTLTAVLADAANNSFSCTIEIKMVRDPQKASQSPFTFIGDVTGDGNNDVVTYEASSGIVFVAQQDVSLNVIYRQFATLPVAESYKDPLFANFTPGKKSLLIRGATTQKWKLLLSDGVKFNVQDVGTWPQNTAFDTVAYGSDINGDGKGDITFTMNSLSYYSTLLFDSVGMGSVSQPILVPPNPTLSASAASYGGTSTLSWLANNAKDCSVRQGATILGSGPSGTYTTGALIADTTFSLLCKHPETNADITVQAIAHVIPPPPPVMDFHVKAAAGSGPDVTLVRNNAKVFYTYLVSNVASCILSRNGSSIFSQSGGTISAPLVKTDTESTPLTARTKFELSCIPLNGSAAVKAEATVAVEADMTLSATSLNFGTLVINTDGTAQTLTLSKVADRKLPTKVKVGATPAGFSRAGGNCPAINTEFTLDTPCTVIYNARPTEAKAYDAQVVVSFDTGFGLKTPELKFNLKVTGTAPAKTTQK